MKMRLLVLLLVAVLAVPVMTGCQAGQMAGRALEQGAEAAGDAMKKAVDPTAATASGKTVTPALTLEEAKSIALKHAGFTADQVTALRTEYEIEHSIPKYDVEFHRGSWEYDYEIHADTGEILSYSRDD